MPDTSAYTAADQAQLNELVDEYLPLVKKIGLHLVARLPPNIDLDDLMQVGVIGLIQASSSYDPSRGASFATYAGIRIKGAMIDEVRRNDWAPRSVQGNMRRIGDAIQTLEARLGRGASDAEIAAELEMDLEEYHQASAELASCRLASLDELAPAIEADEADPSTLFEDFRLRQELLHAIENLPEKEKLMMSLYYGDELNLKEIGEVLGVSESRVSQIHGQALARLRGRIGL
jgi:RNA polymerase sigma factor for flagellar operon FliA